MKRNELIDLLKGVAIFLVVMGHAVQWLSGYDTSNRLFIAIYSFHMPLFMFLSGFVSFNSRREVKLGKRFQVLVIPFFAWFLVRELIYKYPYRLSSFIDDFQLLLFDPATGRWFLWILFFLCLLLFIALKISKQNEELVLIGMILLLFFVSGVLFTSKPFYGLPELTWYLLFFTLGYLINKHQQIWLKYANNIGLISVFAFPLLVSLIKASGKNTFLEETSLTETTKNILYALHTYAVAIAGIFAFYFIFDKLNKFSFKIKNYFIYLGKLSLEIYVTHYYFYFLIKNLSKLFKRKIKSSKNF
ncbi:acyltransferase [Capnocytophaga stomatis]|uniref:Acyltransferase n=2 Tax=Capnocytophaga stomatis TaxID=1848904 RepID=A0A250FUN1_9FLAO|nr:acyltransferase family protein [Capnocytophaga stomatis]ATA88879.1 acyltransferase [Capnocytophaga stomatis]